MKDSILPTVKTFGKNMLREIDEDDLIAYAYQLTYSLLLAIFPFLIFLFTLIGYSDLDSAALLDSLDTSLPASIYSLISEILTDVIDNERGGLLSFSVFLAIYSASVGFRAFMKGANKALGIEDERHIVLKYALSVVFVIIFALAILIALVSLVFGGQILNLLADFIPIIPLSGLINVIRTMLPIGLIFLIITGFYIFVPAKRLKLKQAIPGSLFFTLSWTGFTFLFQFYVENFSNYSRFYGALGAVVALMLWFLLTSIMLLVGVEINNVLQEMKKGS
ncbi:MAG TPA: YihY/virulence factor BrkB family protein [Eubacteriaceae bacterium]|nr:YihY/virulence factor BrkB family protein [Eubacteriaceae bacterium]